MWASKCNSMKQLKRRVGKGGLSKICSSMDIGIETGNGIFQHVNLG